MNKKSNCDLLAHAIREIHTVNYTDSDPATDKLLADIKLAYWRYKTGVEHVGMLANLVPMEGPEGVMFTADTHT